MKDKETNAGTAQGKINISRKIFLPLIREEFVKIAIKIPKPIGNSVDKTVQIAVQPRTEASD